MPYNYGGIDRDELQDYKIFPEGTYDFYIEGVAEHLNNSGEQVVVFTLKPVDFNLQKYGRIFHRINLENEFARKSVARLLLALGQDIEQSGEIFFNRYEGEHLRAKVVHREYKGKTYANSFLVSKDKVEEKSKGFSFKEVKKGISQKEEIAQKFDNDDSLDIPF